MTHKPNGSHIENRLGWLLRREADAETPRFSPALHERILQTVSRQQMAVRRAPTAVEGNARSRSANSWKRLVPWAAATAAVIGIAISVFWPSFTVDTRPSGDGASAPSGNRVAAAPSALPESTSDFTAQPASDPLVEAIDELSVAAASTGNQIVQSVVDQSLVDWHWEFWDRNARVIRDVLLDPLPISWQPTDSDQELASQENS